jgi:hypothetical protein
MGMRRLIRRLLVSALQYFFNKRFSKMAFRVAGILPWLVCVDSWDAFVAPGLEVWIIGKQVYAFVLSLIEKFVYSGV